MDYPILSIITFLPLVGIIAMLFIPSGKKGMISFLATLITAITFIVSLPLYTMYDASKGGFQFTEKMDWISSLGIQYHLAMDGIALTLVLLTTFLSMIAVISSYTAIEKRYKEYMILLLLLQIGMTGVFTSMDLFLFYIFWEVILIPMYLLIGIWGGKERVYASIKFFLYTLAGSTMMLIAIIYLAWMHKNQFGQWSFQLLQIQKLAMDVNTQVLLFSAFALGFSIKVPLFPFHTWLPDAHTEAPTAGSVILAGVLLKMGTYGFLRFNIPLFPDATQLFAPVMMWLSVIGIVYGALMAMVQTDIKRLVAYSSVSHLGFVMLGIFALNEEGLTGGILQMINHGISTGMLFLIVGMIYERKHTRLIADYGGIAKVIPVFSVFFMIATLSSIGLPGMNGFVGEIMIMTGGFLARPLFGIIAASGVILAAVYMLWMYQRVMFGPLKHASNENLKDLNLREIGILVPLVALIFWIGVYPKGLTDKFAQDVKRLMHYSGKVTVQAVKPVMKTEKKEISH